VTRAQRRIEEHRQGEACVEVRDSAGRPCSGVLAWVEQETHAFALGCFVPDLAALAEADRRRYADRLREVFNRFEPAGRPPDAAVTRCEVPEAVHLGRFSRKLDRLSSAGLPLEVSIRGRSVGVGAADERAAAERVAELYAVCFAHPAVRGIFWDGFWDGEEGAAGGGLLRLDFAPRPAFRFLQKLIDTVWHTRAAGETDREGLFRFRGFFGDYRAAVRVGEAVTTVQFSHRGPPGESTSARVEVSSEPVSRPESLRLGQETHHEPT
jgi:hypothetical protein